MPHSKKSALRILTCAAASVAFLAATVSVAQAQYTAVWYDSFNVSMATNKTSFEYNNGVRQSGALGFIGYSQLPAGGDYHHQVIGNPGPLLLAGDVANQYTAVQPQYSFAGSIFGSQVVGKKISFSLDVNATTSAGYTAAGISLGSSSGLTLLDAATTHFGVKFIEDGPTGFGSGNFIQFWDGSSLVANSLAFAAGGAGAFNVELFIDDLADGNPWDGVGSTSIDLYVNGSFISGYTKGGGGYTSDYLTLVGERGFTSPDGLTIATHTFDDLTVFAAPVPEPATLALAGLGLVGLLAFRRRR